MFRRCVLVVVLLVLGSLAITAPSGAASVIWTEDFSGCAAPSGGTYEPSGTTTAKASPSPIVVDLYSNTLLSCTDWSATGQAWMAVYRSGGAFPGGATRAAWLNESPSGSISRSVTSLTVGRQYRVSADAWTDNKDEPTALGLETSGKTLSMSMAAGTGVQQISVSFCATGTSATVRLFENGGSQSSPVVTNIKLEDVGQPCLDAVADALSVAPGGTGSVDVLANDVSKEGGATTPGSTLAVVSGGSAGGAATFSGSTLTYVPLASEAGTTVTIKYRLCPPGETEGEPCSEGTVTIIVLPAEGGDSDETPMDPRPDLTNAGAATWPLLSLSFMMIGSGMLLSQTRRHTI